MATLSPVFDDDEIAFAAAIVADGALGRAQYDLQSKLGMFILPQIGRVASAKPTARSRDQDAGNETISK